jgi:phenylalanine ammonia-lyase
MSYQQGNFFSGHIAIDMDQLRSYLGLMAKHMDAQIALLVTPEFSKGLPPSLIGDNKSSIKHGLKGLQIAANSIMPLLLPAGHGIVQYFPTHAEQFNQNINSQGFASANLAWRSIDLFQQYVAIATLFAIQVIELRAFKQYQTYDPRPYMSSPTSELYEILYQLLGQDITENSPLIRVNNEQALDSYLTLLSQELKKPASKLYDLIRKNMSNLDWI